MFGSRPKPSRPVLLLIVYGLFLVVVGVTATAQTAMVSLHFATASLRTTVQSDAATIRVFVNGFLRPSDLAGVDDPVRTAAIERGLTALASQDAISRIEIRDPSGVVRFSNDPAARGHAAPLTPSFATALAGTVEPSVLLDGAEPETAGAPLGYARAVRAYLPLLDGSGHVQGVVAVWRDAAPILAELDSIRTQIVLVTISAAVIAAVLLYLVFRSAQTRILRQTEELVESTRRDALTGILNHGALVSELAVAIEGARAADRPIGVALVDLDNFRLLNDTHGHAAGDDVLCRLAAHFRAALPPGTTFGRYGPDEFLLIAAAADVEVIEPAIEAIRNRLVDESLQFDTTERMPISISAGIAVFPEHAASVTELLSTVAVVLTEAKASGGDATRVAGRTPAETDQGRSFGVLQGLVFAVDTKDRYTKRHSEDVARYAVFLARALGFEETELQAVRTAGLLHDVGKIGIPDTVLRKPGKLTDAEYDIVKQHVALGDAIVRDVADVEMVRAGIRHHHERWDGRGYLHALAGEEIPLIARILAIGDAFSAMTTTRPYRKALSIEEALRRLGDAAGTQLDERLVTIFLREIESAPDAPLPGAEQAGLGLWLPGAQVA